MERKSAFLEEVGGALRPSSLSMQIKLNITRYQTDPSHHVDLLRRYLAMHVDLSVDVHE